MFSSSNLGTCQPNKSSSERSKKVPFGSSARARKQSTEFPLKRGVSCRHHKEKKLRSSCCILHQRWQIRIWERKLKTKFVFYFCFTQVIQDCGELRVRTPSESPLDVWKRTNSTLLSYLDLLGPGSAILGASFS